MKVLIQFKRGGVQIMDFIKEEYLKEYLFKQGQRIKGYEIL